MILANISNGLPFPHDGVCYFQSNYGHQCKMGYFRIDAMPLDAVIYLMQGGEITIVDATHHIKPYTDAQKFGVVTWCLVYNRAIRKRVDKICSWQTRDMEIVASNGIHKKLISTIRKLARYYNPIGPAVIGKNVKLVCHQKFLADDRPIALKEMIYESISNENSSR